MEPQMKDIYLKNDGIVQMYFNSTLYIDASEDLDSAVKKIIFTLKNNNIYNSKFVNRFKNIKRLDSIFKIINFKTLFNDLNGLQKLPNISNSPKPPKTPKTPNLSQSDFAYFPLEKFLNNPKLQRKVVYFNNKTFL